MNEPLSPPKPVSRSSHSRKIDLRHLAVAHNVNADPDLAGDDIGDRRFDLDRERRLVNRAAKRTIREEGQECGGPRQAAAMGRQNPLAGWRHRDCHSSIRCRSTELEFWYKEPTR